MRTLALLSCVAFSAATVTTQQTWIVDAAASPGHDFTSLAPAITAASAGDTVLVLAGAYSEPFLAIDRGISILAVGDVDLVLASEGGGSTASLRVHDIPGDQAFSLVGFQLSGVFLSAVLRAHDCAGVVSFEGLVGAPGGPFGGSAEGLSIRFDDCDRAHLQDCVSIGGNLRFVNSRGTILDCTLTEDAFQPVFLTNSDVVIEDSSISNSATPDSQLLFGSPLDIDGGRVRIARSSVSAQSILNSASAIHTTLGTVLELDPTVDLTSTTVATPGVSGAGTVLEAEFTTLQVQVSAGNVHLDVQASIGDAYVTLLSFPNPGARTPWGDLWIDPLANVVLQSGALTQRSAAVDVATTGLPPGFRAVVQAISFDGNFDFSNGVAVVFR